MLTKIYDNFIIKKYKIKDIENIIKLYAITIFADHKIKSIEIVSTNNIIHDIIDDYYEDVPNKRRKLLYDYYFSLLKKYLIKYNSDSSNFDLDKIEILNNFKNFKYKNIDTIKKILECDNEVTPSEREFFNEIKERLQ